MQDYKSTYSGHDLCYTQTACTISSASTAKIVRYEHISNLNHFITVLCRPTVLPVILLVSP